MARNYVDRDTSVKSQISDELRDFGFSKAIKINEVQVVMELIIDSEGRPIGYELFPGNTFEGKTILKVLEKLKEKFMLENVIIVADKGLNSKLNFLDIKSHGFDYIVSARIKNMVAKIKEALNMMEFSEVKIENEIYF